MDDCREYIMYPTKGKYEHVVLPKDAKQFHGYQEDPRRIARIHMEMIQCVTCLDTGKILDKPCTREQGHKIEQKQNKENRPRHLWQEEIHELVRRARRAKDVFLQMSSALDF